MKLYKQKLRIHLHSGPTKCSGGEIVEKKNKTHKRVATSLQAEVSNMKVPTIYWLSKRHKSPKKYRFISSLNHCSVTILSFLLTSASDTIKTAIVIFSNKGYEKSGINYFLSIKRA